ncbi:hypothetical protein LPJ59_000567 [Coemansia sp. RSA 2399]|nr:hypothetical protein LPJ59_000567 [Coemansia sp. RSA 2399]KAJ1908221.1 hypothetical protein LPJ81_000235 [Coemansia sp. IMI 209127]
MSQGHPIYTPQATGMRYYHDSHAPGVHSVPAHEPPPAAATAASTVNILHRRSHHALPSPPPPPASSSLSPYSSGPLCWSPGASGAQAAGSVNTLPPIMALAAIAPPPGPTPAPSPTTLVHTYLGAETHAPPALAPDAQPRAKRHKSISAGAEDQDRTPPPQRRSSNKRTARSSTDTQQQLSADEAVGSTGIEAARILEERRRRNANASARFRKRRNERERELVTRCLFLEHHLLQSVGPSAFDQLMRKAPAAAAIEGSVVGRRSAAATAASADMRDLLSTPLQGADGTDEDLAATDNSGRKLSVTALTAPRTVDDVWSAYLSLSQQVSTVAQRVQSLEDYSR